MHAFYFGNSERPLYGVSHSPKGNVYRDSAVLICNSIGHEYIRSHRALKQLADRLSDMGYHVLRFDYTGVGDSSGDFGKVKLSDWLNDINLAAEELRATSGQDKITVIGLRVGATLSLLSSMQCNFNNIIMWDPVISGEGFINNLNTLHRQLLVDRMWFSEDRSEEDTPGDEYLGYKYSKNVIDKFKKINLLECPVPNNQLLNTVYTSDNDINSLNNYLKENVDNYSYEFVKDMGGWEELSFIETSLASAGVLNHICEALK